jgi:hypothetical protein
MLDLVGGQVVKTKAIWIQFNTTRDLSSAQSVQSRTMKKEKDVEDIDGTEKE